jgi:AcrR family transcriptional regulator
MADEGRTGELDDAAGEQPGTPIDEAGRPADDGAGEGLSEEGRIRSVLVRELGEELADAFVAARETQERWARRRHPHEGLRERKKRRTRQQISDVATTLFVVRGFDQVKVSEIAAIVGVSEKTVYNYFPTKESLLFDRADETIERLAGALRERRVDESPTKAVLRALGEDMDDLEDMPDAIYVLLPMFDELVDTTPALRAARLDLQGRLVEVATQELAALAEVDPRDPEPMIAARALVALADLSYASRRRHIEGGLRGRELREAVVADLERAARLLDTGLWSFTLLTLGTRTRQQMREASAATEQARRQVSEALRQARTAWHELSGRERAETKRAKADARRLAADAKRHAAELKRTAMQAAQQAAYEALREKLAERHEAIRARRGRTAEGPGEPR